MTEVSCGSRRSKWVMAWVTEIGDRSGSWRGSRRSEIEVGHGVGHVDRRSEWAEVGFWLWFLVVFGVGLVFLVVIFGCGCGFCA